MAAEYQVKRDCVVVLMPLCHYSDSRTVRLDGWVEERQEGIRELGDNVLKFVLIFSKNRRVLSQI